jgi:RNA polymerase sigma-70 factor (ECF subfamily)
MTAEEAWAYATVSNDAPLTREEQVIQLFESLRDSVYRYILTLLREPAAAEEITQEVFLRLVRQYRAGRSVKNPRAWIFRVAHNMAVDEARTRKFRRSLDEKEWLELEESRRDTAPGPEESAAEAQQTRRWHVGLTSLPEQQRACLLLRSEGFRYREIAEILGVTISTVAESLRRAIRRMMKDSDA